MLGPETANADRPHGRIATAEPVVFQPFSRAVHKAIARHVAEVRKLYDWPGMPYHDWDQPPENRFNRWQYHNLPMLVQLHHDPRFVAKVSQLVKEALRPSYVFLSMYGKDGVCPCHTDRPQCYMTVDYMVDTDAEKAPWPIYIEGKAYVLKPGEAVLYSGTGQEHYRKPMGEVSDASFANLAFFHFVPTRFLGSRD